ncbi:N utilization substance protein B [Propionigenium maris DSM 9537]|uniref:Transcription antitermination protein NusB n=1 Tax=Propionigenium maris DSM 9537 TaxID=1123000 RepID=A0A9W6GLL8_9FUSO|nr:transcription antitermination factor NusB [Propionigenium maris]GLI55986.1 N utilization substance protein B [Propionigenium maris DSM 9537]
MSRKIAREELFKILFEAELNDASIAEVSERVISRGEVELSKNSKDFIEKYVKGIVEKKDEIEETLNSEMTNWSLDRIGNVERALLKFGTYELMFEDMGHEIVVNEIVELAKKYGDEKSHEFINGVLAKIIKK